MKHTEKDQVVLVEVEAELEAPFVDQDLLPLFVAPKACPENTEEKNSIQSQ